MPSTPTPKNAFLHQSQAIAELLSPEPRPVVVTTGTGSGKTECFLLPVIENAVRDSVRFRRTGLTAILIYPMNAQVEITPADGKTPITFADFAIRDRRIAIYVDSAAFHRGQRLRRDRFIRARLAESGWKVVELRAKDLAKGEQVVEAIRHG